MRLEDYPECDPEQHQHCDEEAYLREVYLLIWGRGVVGRKIVLPYQGLCLRGFNWNHGAMATAGANLFSP